MHQSGKRGPGSEEKDGHRRGMRIIKTSWIDIKKGGDEVRNYRSRLVPKEYNDKNIEGLFAATAPLEALRLLVSEVATYDPSNGTDAGEVFMPNDVARRFFEAPIHREVCIELPYEALEEGEDLTEWVGVLRISLYGTRDAATNWQEPVTQQMERIGFKRGVYNPCTYQHPGRQINAMVHGDYFCSVGQRKDIERFRKQLDKRFSIKITLVGSRCDDEKEVRVLHRVITCTDHGWEYEADQRETKNWTWKVRVQSPVPETRRR